MILEIKYLCNVEIIMISSQKGTIFQNIFGNTVCRQIQITEHFLRFRNGQLERWWDLKDTDWNQRAVDGQYIWQTSWEGY